MHSQAGVGSTDYTHRSHGGYELRKLGPASCRAPQAPMAACKRQAQLSREVHRCAFALWQALDIGTKICYAGELREHDKIEGPGSNCLVETL